MCSGWTPFFLLSLGEPSKKIYILSGHATPPTPLGLNNRHMSKNVSFFMYTIISFWNLRDYKKTQAFFYLPQKTYIS